MNTDIFHVIIWAETPTDIVMMLGLEGPLTRESDAALAVEAYRTAIERHVPAGFPNYTRVGVMRIPAPGDQSNHPAPRTDIEEVIAEIEKRLERRPAWLIL